MAEKFTMDDGIVVKVSGDLVIKAVARKGWKRAVAYALRREVAIADALKELRGKISPTR